MIVKVVVVVSADVLYRQHVLHELIGPSTDPYYTPLLTLVDMKDYLLMLTDLFTV